MNEHQLADVIINLKRAVEIRVRHLDETYRFKKLPLPKSISGLYDRMCALGVVRPKMLGKLYEIRNAIEHRDEPPPDSSRCQELLEFAWYFLKSTDGISRERTTEITFIQGDSEEEGYWLEIKYSEDPEIEISFTGWLPFELVSTSPLDDWYEATIDSRETKVELRARVSIPPEHDHTRSFRNEDVFIQGKLKGDVARLAFVRRLFESR